VALGDTMRQTVIDRVLGDIPTAIPAARVAVRLDRVHRGGRGQLVAAAGRRQDQVIDLMSPPCTRRLPRRNLDRRGAHMMRAADSTR